MPQLTYDGFNTVAVLDTDAGTVTLTHSGMTMPKHKKSSSPWVIPLGAITDVDFREKNALVRGHVRFVLTDRVGWAKNPFEDVSAFMSGKEKLEPFVNAVNQARQGAVSTAVVAAPVQSRLERINERLAETEQAMRDNATFQGIALRDGQTLEFNKQTFPVAGARATVEVGGTRRRTTATRIVVGSAMTGGLGGAMVGAMAKKSSSNVYVSIEMADGQTIVVEADQKKEGQARQFAATVTSAGARARNSSSEVIDAEFVEEPLITQPVQQQISSAATPPPPPPPPPSVPADWYPDANNSTLLRYWDGGRWTEHTAPRPPQ